MPMPVGQIGNSVPMPVGQIGNSVPMSRRLNREAPAKPGAFLLLDLLPLSWAKLHMLFDLGLVMDLSDHTDCCGSECKLFHLGAFPLIHLAEFLQIVVGVFVLHGPSYSS